MSELENSSTIPKWFWIVSTLALIWNLLGVMAYINQVTLTPEALAAMTEAEKALFENTPAWANGAFAIAVFGGALGSLFLLLNKAMAMMTLVISMLAVFVQMGHAYLISNSFEVFGPGGAIMPVMVTIIAMLLVWLANTSKQKSWLT